MKANDKVSVLLTVFLEATKGAGMTEERAEAIYEDIVAHIENMKEGFSEVLLAEVAKVLALEAHDDAWIIEYADELKAQLIELAQAGAPRPEPGTVLSRALEMFTDTDKEEKPSKWDERAKLYKVVQERGSNQGYHQKHGEKVLYCGYDRLEAVQIYETKSAEDHDPGPGSQYQSTRMLSKSVRAE